MNYMLHEVSCKAAIYNQDDSKILMVKYLSSGKYGLPGGHLDQNETPIEAMERELQEELGLSGVALKPASFFVHQSGKIVLGFVGQITEGSVEFGISQDNEIGEWIELSEIDKIEADPGFIKFAKQNQPRL